MVGFYGEGLVFESEGAAITIGVDAPDISHGVADEAWPFETTYPCINNSGPSR